MLSSEVEVTAAVEGGDLGIRLQVGTIAGDDEMMALQPGELAGLASSTTPSSPVFPGPKIKVLPVKKPGAAGALDHALAFAGGDRR